MRACLWVGVAGVCGLLACSAPPTEELPSFGSAPPIAGASSAAGAPENAAGGATARAGAGSGGAVMAGAPAGGSSSGAGGSAGLPVVGSGGGAGAPASGGAGTGGAPIGGAAGAGSATCSNTTPSVLGTCTYYARSCLDAQGGSLTYETNDGDSFACAAPTDCAAAQSAMENHCASSGAAGSGGSGGQPGGAGVGGGGSAGAPSCDPTDICCAAAVSKALSHACYSITGDGEFWTDKNHRVGCANPCGQSPAATAATETMCRADDVPFCVFDDSAGCWKCIN